MTTKNFKSKQGMKELSCERQKIDWPIKKISLEVKN